MISHVLNRIPNDFQKLFTLIILCTTYGQLFAQPSPGDVFKEYTWHNESGDCNGALRVGGNLDYRIQKAVDNYMGDGLIKPPFHIDLKMATRAELVIEKMLCHGETKGLRVIVNGYKPIYIPEARNIPNPQSAYAHHFNQVVPLDLSYLKEGTGNTFAFEVDTSGHWWPQNLLYGMILRIYYEPSVIEYKGRITQPSGGETLGLLNDIKVEAPDSEKVKKIDLVGRYEDVDLEGDGLYRQWHYGYHKCQIYNHIGTSTSHPHHFQWNTEWIPDQQEEISLAAFVHRVDGFIYMTEPVNKLTLQRPGISIELCKPYKRPKGWFTRNGEFSERLQIQGNLDHAVEAKMVFRSWSPGYFNGIYINDFLVFLKEGPTYETFEHDIPIKDLNVFKQGENILKTGKTPLYPEGMVHGVEIQWPGIMILIKYRSNPGPTL